LFSHKFGQFLFDTKKKAMEMILISKLTKNLPEIWDIIFIQAAERLTTHAESQAVSLF